MATTPIDSMQSQDSTSKPLEDSSLVEEPSTLRLSVDVDLLMPEFLADETFGIDNHFVSEYVDSLLVERDSTHVEGSVHVSPYHPWFEEPKVPFHSSFDSVPDAYTPVSSEHIDDFHPHFIIEESPLSTHEPELAHLEDGIPKSSEEQGIFAPQTTNTFDSIPTPPSPGNSLPIADSSETIHTPEDIESQLSNLYLSYRRSVSRLATLSDPFDSSPSSIPSVGDPDAQAEIMMTKAQYQLTLEEGRFWDGFSAELRESKLPDALKRLSQRSEYMSASFERRMNPPTSSTYTESKEILNAMGVPCLEASGAYEAEALASSMVLNGLADYVISEDTVRFLVHPFAISAIQNLNDW